jgi:carboxymethylenebutenolidase
MAKVPTTTTTKELLEVWLQQCYFELVKKNAKAAPGTMSDNPHVVKVPLAMGGRRREGVYNFYHDYFLAQFPADMTAVAISLVVGENILAEEAVYQFTNNQVIDWLVPGVPPTGKRVEAGVVGIITFENGKIDSEHLYWDQASVLAQWGVLDSSERKRKPSHLNAVGRSTAGTEMTRAAGGISTQSVAEPHSKREHPAGFHECFARCRSLLHFTACRILGSSAEAELAVRNCWHRASRNPRRFSHEGAFRAWLVRLLMDEALAILHRPACPLLSTQL